MELVVYQGYVYDISDYMYCHSRGFDWIEPYLGKNIDEVFKQVGHTISALKVIAQLPNVGMIHGAENIEYDSLSPKFKEPFTFDPSKGLWR